MKPSGFILILMFLSYDGTVLKMYNKMVFNNESWLCFHVSRCHGQKCRERRRLLLFQKKREVRSRRWRPIAVIDIFSFHIFFSHFFCICCLVILIEETTVFYYYIKDVEHIWTSHFHVSARLLPTTWWSLMMPRTIEPLRVKREK